MSSTTSSTKQSVLSPKQYVSQNNSCGSAFNCGAGYATLQAQVEQLTNRVNQLEEENQKTNDYYQTAKGLINLQRFLLILLPVVELVAIGIVIYIFNKSNTIGYVVIGLIGLTTLLNGFVLPHQIKSIEERVTKIESQK